MRTLLHVLLILHLSDIKIKLQRVFGEEKFSYPVFLIQNPIYDEIFYIVEQIGVVKACSYNKCLVFLDIKDRVDFGGEKGLFSIAFSPNFKQDGKIFVSYTNKYGNSVISFFVSKDRKFVVNVKDEKVILRLRQPFPNHNGGMILFGPDNMLYIAFGDGGGAGDPFGYGQNKKTLHGKILRIDVSTFPYKIPKDNPFYGDAICGLGQKPKEACAEIFAWGLRNPWRFSFDEEKILAGDVGQNTWEEINIIEKGKNYGWNCYEGFEKFKDCESGEFTYPITVYQLYKDGDCSIIGGYVYRGERIPQLYGKYIFGDYCSGKIQYLDLEDKKQYLLLKTKISISSFSIDKEGEIYVIDHKGGKIYKIIQDE